jgi:hypothetical protein
MNYTNIEIFDLDGTVIDSIHRYKTLKCGTKIDLQYWRDNAIPEKILKDKLLPLAEYYQDCLKKAGFYVVVATSRVITSADYIFIKEILGNGTMPDRFIHRKNDSDSRKGSEIKARPIRSIMNLKCFKDAEINFYDDNLDYLQGFKDIIPETITHHIPSNQGH